MQSGNNVGTGLEAGTLSLASSESLNAIGSYLPLRGVRGRDVSPPSVNFHRMEPRRFQLMEPGDFQVMAPVDFH